MKIQDTGRLNTMTNSARGVPRVLGPPKGSVDARREFLLKGSWLNCTLILADTAFDIDDDFGQPFRKLRRSGLLVVMSIQKRAS